MQNKYFLREQSVTAIVLTITCTLHSAWNVTTVWHIGYSPVTRVGPTGAGPQQKSSGPRQK